MTFDTGSLGGILLHPLLLAGAFLLAGYVLTRFILVHRPFARVLCQIASFAGFTLMLLRAEVVPFQPTPAADHSVTFVVIGLFKIVWWLAASWLLSGCLRSFPLFKRQPRETRFLQDLLSGFIYICAVLGIIAYVFDLPVSGLLAASGVVAIVLGLALQSTLGDVFSGIVLNLAKPYHPGDWVILDGGMEGRVLETNWRATQLLTVNNDLAVVPNSLIAKAKLINASQPRSAHGFTVAVRLDPTAAPSRSCSVLETALLSCNRILHVPAPSVMVRTLDALALECELQAFVPTPDDAPAARTELFDLVFRHCASAGIRLAPPTGSAVALPGRSVRPDPAEMPRRLLEHLLVFAALSEQERQFLAPRMKRRSFRAGETLREWGAVPQALSVLSAGVLAVIQQHGGEEVEIMRLAPGDCFGQRGVLSGAPAGFTIKALTRVTIYDLANADLAPILKEKPALAAELSHALARREAAARHDAEIVPDDHPGNFAGRLAERVKDLLGIE